MHKHKKPIAALIIAFLISGCGSLTPDWMGKEDEDFLPGKRISVLAHGSKLKRSPSHRSITIQLDKQKANTHWVKQRISSTSHPALGGQNSQQALAVIDSTSVGSGDDDDLRLTSTPIIANNLIFTLDGEGTIQARDVNDIDRLIWEISILPEDSEGFLGGNIAFDKNTLFATSAHGFIYALDAKNGTERWKRNVKLPIKSTVTAGNNLLYFITISNKLYALEQKNGRIAWTHLGIDETTSIYGATGPTLSPDNKTLVVPYSSGELVVFDSKEGTPLWTDVLVGNQQDQIVSFAINDIDATPIISKNHLYATSHDGILKAYALRTGQLMWKQDISTVQTPWLSGDFLYILTSSNELVCIHTPDGRIKWIGQFPTHGEALIDWGGKNKGEAIYWSGPVLAGNKLLVLGSTGVLSIVSPYTGEIQQNITISDNIYLPPVVANNTAYLLTNDAKLIALR